MSDIKRGDLGNENVFFKNAFKHLSVALESKFYNNKMSFFINYHKWFIQKEYRIVILIDTYKFIKVSKKML